MKGGGSEEDEEGQTRMVKKAAEITFFPYNNEG